MISQTRKTRVLIADDHAIVRAGVRAVFAQASEYVVVGEAQDCTSLVQAVGRQLPDLVVMDFAAEGPPGLAAIADIKGRHPDTRILILTGDRSRDHVVAALQAGANGYILKEAGIPELLDALACVCRGNTYLSSEIAGIVIGSGFGQMRETAAGATPTTLSQREAQVLKLVAAGKTSKQIAGHLFISPRTVEKHRAHVMRKLNLNSLVALLTFAIGNNFVQRAESVMGFTAQLRRSSAPVVCRKPGGP
jgi:two-component system, NarL family, response regulator NreC